MYIEPTTRGAYLGGNDCCIGRSRFLILMHPKAWRACPKCLCTTEMLTPLARCPSCEIEMKRGCDLPIRAPVRRVSMRQLGHFMMGDARAAGHTITLSGTYGGDGLTVTSRWRSTRRASPIPPELHAAWNAGGGWNDAGAEAPAMVEWARAHLKELTR